MTITTNSPRPKLMSQIEQERLATLQSYDVLDAKVESQFDEIVGLAALICDKPIAYISFIDDQTQWLKSKVGITLDKTSKESSFCQHILDTQDLLVVEDVTKDCRFKDNVFVEGPPHIRFYAGAPIVDTNGFVLGSICVMDTKTAELNDIQKQSLVSLSKQVSYNLVGRKKNIDLLQEKDRAENNSKLKSEFLSTMSHEIRTPLNGIISITHLLNAEKGTSPQYRDYFRNLRFASEGLLSLVNDILDFSKIEAGKIELFEEKFNLKTFLEDVSNTFKFKAEENQTTINFEWDDKLPENYVGDKFRLAQVLNNLISNSVKFTKQGTITLRAAQSKTEVDNGFQRILFEVIDSGIGIPKNKVNSVFESFSQATRSTAKLFGGTGLGLSISKSLLELFDSTIAVESTEGKGSCFFFELNLKSSTANKTINTHQNGKKDIGDIKVLLAEDNELNVFVVQRFMDLWNVNLQVVENGLLAVEKCQESKFDIILMDIEMPEMGGREASKLIKQGESKNNDTPIHAMTAYAISEIDDLPETEFFSGYLSKPLNPGQLFDTLSGSKSSH